MIVPDFNAICWNVRGLNSTARCLAVHELIAGTHCHLVCLQETKLQNIDGALASFLGGHRHNAFAYKSARGTKRGILLLWNDAAVNIENIVIRHFSITATMTLRDCLTDFLLTAVYDLSRDNRKGEFL